MLWVLLIGVLVMVVMGIGAGFLEIWFEGEKEKDENNWRGLL
jgi:hypothetical protein